MDPKPTSHYSLTRKQEAILTLLYRFRFTTSAHISQTLGIGKATINKRLSLLVETGYIGRRYSQEYRLLRKPASYYLLPKGIDALQALDSDKFDARILRNIRKDQHTSDQFIEQSLGIFDICCRLTAKLGNDLRFFTKSQLAHKYDYFSGFMPMAYMRINRNGAERDFFIEYLQPSKPLFAVIQRLQAYVDYADGGDWEEGTGSEFPAVLYVCETKRLRDRLLKRATAVLDETDDDLKFYVAALDDLNSWQNLADHEERPRPLSML